MDRPLTSRLRCERGQTSVEYVGLILLVAATIAAITASGIPGKVSGAVDGALCKIVELGCSGSGGSGDLAGTGGASGAPGAPATPGAPRPGAAGAPGDEQQAPGSPPPSGGEPTAGAAAGGASRGGQADRLPTKGRYPYVPPKGSHGKPQRVRRGGFRDRSGNHWKWDPKGHWDVQHPDESHTNVGPRDESNEGEVDHGRDKFPSQPRPQPVPEPLPPPDSGQEEDKGGDAAKAAAGAAAAAGGAGALWWAAKLLSPACGPFAPACALAL